MHKDMTHTLDNLPLNLFMGFLKLRGQHIYGFTYNLYVLNKPKEQDGVFNSLLITVMRTTFQKHIYCFQNMLKPYFVFNWFSHTLKFYPFPRWAEQKAAGILLPLHLHYA